jgi:hypothetical protein
MKKGRRKNSMKWLGKRKFLVAIIVVIILGLFFFDFSFLKGEIINYSLLCGRENYAKYRCTEKWLPLNPTIYKPSVARQEVSYSMFGVYIETLKKCEVVNRRNWTCMFDDELATFGFRNGQYWETPFGELFKYRYVPKYIYRLEEMKWW